MTGRWLIACLFALSAACGGDTEAPSAKQDREMNEAAGMLDDAPSSLSQVDDGGLEQEIEAKAAAEDAANR